MLLKPFDPVVATCASRASADEAVTLLTRAGYGRSMLAVVGNEGAAVKTECKGRRPSSWATSGALWGLLWVAFTALATRAVPLGSPAFGALVMLGAVTLVVQTTIAACLVAPEAAVPAGTPAPRNPVNAGASSFAVVVHGNRSEVALARAILAA